MNDIEKILGDDDELFGSLEDIFGDSYSQNDTGSFSVATGIGSDKIEYVQNTVSGKMVNSADAKAIFLSMAQSTKVKSGIQEITIGNYVFTANELKAIFMDITRYAAEKIFVNH